MSLSMRLVNYLHQNQINYQTLYHPKTTNSIGTAIAAQVPPQQIAKAVVLKDHQDHTVMAVIPANHKLSLSALSEEMHADFRLAKEQQVFETFSDCERGAIPPVGQAYNIRVVCDPLLDHQDWIYFEGGDHQSLIRISHDDFIQLMATSKHIRISHQAFH
ncbi:aminoacyl-tRNA deacylase [Paraferrimonas sedimenticola]|uniref:YbaK/aminoacyl-tRNA synthetase-associated domain-containing protein n=1 Tax=Paraferrimonas sedimenticola TaxID=375674 RepID=A0AA37RXP8_9GAMM|nr:YbaK/EbsC family protein [Paraferrimonas sedimenticola]GLP96968.1 hypothetical protein GCM10007895_22740 [Paraferrimonas sedimenticola]